MVKEDQIFAGQRSFNGRPLTVTVMPWSHHVLGYEIPREREDWHEENLYEGHYGYEMEMLEQTRREKVPFQIGFAFKFSQIRSDLSLEWLGNFSDSEKSTN